MSPAPRNPTSKHSGGLGAFTLIELLVVISIIAILAAMLIPSIGLVKANAVKSTCLSNMRQIGAGFASYAIDNDHLIPLAQPGVESRCNYYLQLNNIPYGIGIIATQEQLPPKSIYCPSNTKPSHKLSDPSNPWTNLAYPIPDSQLRTSYAVCWAQLPTTETSAAVYLTPQRALVTDQCNCRSAMTYQHKIGANVLMGDGSGKFVQWTKIQAAFDAIPLFYSNVANEPEIANYYKALAAN